MCRAAFASFLRKERGVNAAEYDPGAAFARQPPDRVSAQRIAGVNPDADDIPRSEVRRIDVLKRFVNQVWIAPARPGRGGQDVQPPRRDDGDAKREVAWIDQMNARVWRHRVEFTLP